MVDSFHIVEQASESLRAQFPDGMRRCGPDALRFALLRHDVTSVDINIDIKHEAEEGLRYTSALVCILNYFIKLNIIKTFSHSQALEIKKLHF